MCSCGKDIQTLSHYLRHCPDYLQERVTLLNTVMCIIPNILDLSNAPLTEIHLHGKEKLDNINNRSTLDLILNT